MPYLLIRTGPSAEQRIALTKDRTVLGRHPDADIRLAEGVISSRHAVISLEENRCFIEDGDGQGRKSRNHTFVNDQEVPFPTRAQLNHNDTIKICNFICIFRDDDSRKPLPRHLRPAVPKPESEPEVVDDGDTSSSIRAFISHSDSSFALQTQPADRLKILVEVSNLLSRTLEVPAIWPPLMDILFRLFPQTDRGFVVRPDEASGELMDEYKRTRRAGAEADARSSANVVGPCMEKLEASLSGDGGKKLPSSASVVEASIRSVMCAPLWSHDRQPLGALQLDTQDPRRAFTPDDLNLLLGVASQASIAVDNARLYQESLAQQRFQRDLDMARDVVASFQPLAVPQLAGYEFFAHYEPAQEVGGDYYDFVPLPGGKLAVLLGDVAGKGVAAALIMVRFGVEAQAALLTERDPAAAFARLNRSMQRLRETDRFVTLAGVILDPAAHAVLLVNAGHPLPLVLRPGAAATEAAPRSMGGPAIGLFEDAAYTSSLVSLAPGDCLLMFSDGVTDAQNAAGRQFGRKGIEAALKDAGTSPREIGQHLLDAVGRHAAGCSQTDDITTICFGRTLP